MKMSNCKEIREKKEEKKEGNFNVIIQSFQNRLFKYYLIAAER